MIATVSSTTMGSCFFHAETKEVPVVIDAFPNPRQPSISEIDKKTIKERDVMVETHRYEPLKDLTQREKDLVARCIYHESRGESQTGQIAVCEVIFNRVLSCVYPNTIEEVLFQYNGKFYQFSCAPYLLSEPIMEPDSFEAAKAVQEYVLSEEYAPVLPSDYLYFSTGKPANHDYIKIGNHYFW